MDINDNIFKVNEVTSHIKNILERNLDFLKVVGEVSNISFPASGHVYFSLKDEKALIRCVFFAGYNRILQYVPQNGDSVVVSGKVTVYERDGLYQIIATNVSKYGVGQLHEKFEKLKVMLRTEGLFDHSHKKALPKYPKAIGIITSESGAVLHDMLNILSRRYPLDVYHFPTLVQGNEAPQSLISGIKYFVKMKRSKKKVDLIIIGRGGGSFDDLFCFNDEGLARAIHACPIPVISAVGHETDFTICDFVADMRAATPSVAVEIAVQDRNELYFQLSNKEKELLSLTLLKIQSYKQSILLADKRMQSSHPQNIILKQHQRLDYCRYKLLCFIERLNSFATKLENKKNTLHNLSPKHILDRGFVLIEKDGKIVKSRHDIRVKDLVNITFKDGKCFAEIKE